jgi:hypothetical protein
MSSAPHTLLAELITKLKNSRDYKHHLKLFKEFIEFRDRPMRDGNIHYFLYFDLDELKFKIGSEIDITYNTLVLVRGIVPSKHDKKQEKKIEEYGYGWMKNYND